MKKHQVKMLLFFIFLYLVLVPHLSRAAQSCRTASSESIVRDDTANGIKEPEKEFSLPEQAIDAPEDEVKAAPQPEPWAQLVQSFNGTFYLKGDGNSKRVALTFDDGPSPIYTPQVLDVLKEYDVPATFFLIGWRAQANPELVERIIAEGHVIGNHTWSHPRLTEIAEARIRDEMKRTEDILVEITGLRTALMRPPFGAVSTGVLETLQSLYYRVVNWSVDSVDWRDQEVGQILENTLPNVREEGVLLFHDGCGDDQSRAATVEALPVLIETLREQGYSFVTVDKLLGIPAYR